jgi:hypothetical protein
MTSGPIPLPGCRSTTSSIILFRYDHDGYCSPHKPSDRGSDRTGGRLITGPGPCPRDNCGLWSVDLLNSCRYTSLQNRRTAKLGARSPDPAPGDQPQHVAPFHQRGVSWPGAAVKESSGWHGTSATRAGAQDRADLGGEARERGVELLGGAPVRSVYGWRRRWQWYHHWSSFWGTANLGEGRPFFTRLPEPSPLRRG